MRVAVVVPVRNGATGIGNCVSRLLSQTRPPDELVVVDNGSSDGTGRVAAEAGATVLPEPTMGVYRARNAGWRSTTAEVVAFTDADCEPESDWIEKLVEPFAEPTVCGVGGEAVLPEVRTPAQRWVHLRGFMSQEAHFRHGFMPFIATANAAYRRSALDEVDGFDERFLSGGDTDIAWRVQAFAGGNLAYQPQAKVVHRFAERTSELTSRARRYAGGHAILGVKWSAWPQFVAGQGSLAQRTRAVWMLPGRLPYRAMRGRDLTVPLIDAAVRANYEIGLIEGKRRARRLGIGPLPGPADSRLGR